MDAAPVLELPVFDGEADINSQQSHTCHHKVRHRFKGENRVFEVLCREGGLAGDVWGQT